MATIQKDRILEFRGQDLTDSSGSKIGSIEEIYLDTETNEPEWALVHTGLFGTKQTFVPIRDASEADGKLSVPFEKSQVSDAPKVDPDGQLSQREEAELYRHYGMSYSESQSDTGLGERGGAGVESGTTGAGTGTATGVAGTGTAGTTTGVGDTRDDDALDRDRADMSGEGRTGGESFGGAPPVGSDVSGPETDNAMTRSEEELEVGTRQQEAGRARLRKYVVTEEVQQTVPVQREEVRVEREPITDANIDEATSGPELSEEEHEVVLHSEEPVAEKRVVPKERVRLDKDVQTEQRTVSEDVSREEIDVDGDDSGRPDR
jgi:uncharacterized protein (TIGR02271 family)